MHFSFSLAIISSFLLLQNKSCRKDAIKNTTASSTQFYFGADLSYVNQIMENGGSYRDSGKISSPFKIFKDHGANLVRVRIWHDPAWTKEVYGSDGKKVYSNLEEVEQTIRLSKEQGMQVELDFHYSDTWADPGKQEAPRAWKTIKDASILKDSIYSYTFHTLKYLDKKGLMPEWVQVGNEINCGLFYTKAPEGFPLANACKGDWEKLGDYLNAGIKAVRDAGASSTLQPKILLHVADPKNVKWWFDSITTRGKVSDFEAIGFSYYPLWHRSVSLDSISYHIGQWKNRFKKEVMVLETAYPWTIEGIDSYRNSFGAQQPLPGFDFSQEGQLEFLKALTREVKEGGGIGLIYWEPAWITSSMKDLWGTGSSWENATLFDFQGNPTKGMRFMKVN